MMSVKQYYTVFNCRYSFLSKFEFGQCQTAGELVAQCNMMSAAQNELHVISYKPRILDFVDVLEKETRSDDSDRGSISKIVLKSGGQ